MNYTIKEADLERQREDILPLLKRNLKGYPEKKFEWSYLNSPYGKAFCWLITEERAGIVGSTAVFPRKVYLDGVSFNTGVAGDFAVDVKHRALLPALKLQKAVQTSLKDKGLNFVYGVPNELSRAVFARIGYKEVGNYSRAVKVLRANYRDGKYLPPENITRPLSLAINFGLKNLSYERWCGKGKDYTFSISEGFDTRFDTLWQKAMKGRRLISERNSSFLAWRYTASPCGSYEILTMEKGSEGLAGYIVFSICDNISTIADVLHAGGDAALMPLMAEFVRLMRKRKIGSVSISRIGEDLYHNELKKFGFMRAGKDTGARLFMYPAEGSAAPGIEEFRKWHFLDGDIDL